VTHNGFGDRHVTPIDARRLRAGPPIAVGLDPTAVAFAASGARALVATAGDGAVALVDARTGRRRRTARVGGAPRAVAATRSRWVVADGASGRVAGLALGALR
jgi:DNA-binding beta-propeller fold protein YncE